MNLINIPTNEEPDCLKVLIYPHYTFDPDLQGECKKEVQNKLSYLQKGLCAYCEQKLKGIFIEHFIPISTHPQFQLDWNNFLGVCSGVFWEHKPYLRSCSPYKENKLLTLDPRRQDHIESIYYDEDLNIHSSIEILDEDLNTLNLNCNKLVERRNKKFKEIQDLFFDEINISDEYIKTTCLETISYLKRTKEEFSSCLIYAFYKLYNSFS